jgi:hypothetical protein
LPVDPNADVTAAIKAWWATRTDLQALVTLGRLNHATAPENASIEPYLTFFLVSTTNVAATTSFIYWESIVQFNIHHYLPGLAHTLAFTIASALNTLKSGGAQLFIENTQAIHVLPDDFGLEEGEGLGLNGRDCWICHFTVTIPWTN